MPERKTPLLKDYFYHIYNRSTERIAIFRCAADYHFFIGKMLLLSEKLEIALPAWALLPTHYHLLAVQQGEHPVSKLLHRLCTSYAMYFNGRYARTGHLFERRFKAKLVTTEEYLEQVTNYIENNALHHKIVTQVEEWPFTHRMAIEAQQKVPHVFHDDDEFEAF